jgi:type I restriction enzyme M protein
MKQIPLAGLDAVPPQRSEASPHNLPEVFKRLYYHLYTNSKVSRAEAIIEDLSLLLLVKLAADQSGQAKILKRFADGEVSSQDAMLPLLRKAFPNLLAKGQRFALGEQSLRSAVAEMASLDLAHAPAHSIGEAFQALMGPRLRGEKGQFFTPKSLVRAMVEIIDPQPHESVLDPAAGTGGFLAETHLYQLRKYDAKTVFGPLTGVDKDTGLARLGSALLTILCKERGQINNFNSLDAAEWKSVMTQGWEAQFDVVLTNPPFGSKIGVKDKEILQCFDFGHVWTFSKPTGTWTRTSAVGESEDPQMLFLELCVRALKPGGRLGIVLPEGMFGNRLTSYIWDWLRERGDILALLDCPRTTFQPGTDTKTNVLFYQRSSEVRVNRPRGVALAVALNCGHDPRGRSEKANGEIYKDDFGTLARAFHSPLKGQSEWRVEPLGSTDYMVPRYHYYKSDVALDEGGVAAGAKVLTLADLVKKKIISIRKGHEVGSDAYGTGDVPFVRTSDIANFEVSNDPTKSVSEEIYQQYAAQQRLRAGDILMVVDGRYRIGTTAILDSHSARCIAQSHLRIISVLDPSKLDPYELLYALNMASVKIHLRGLVFIQSTLGTLGARLLELKIPILHGAGPWVERVAMFKDSLQKRASHLAELQRMATPEVEL